MIAKFVEGSEPDELLAGAIAIYRDAVGNPDEIIKESEVINSWSNATVRSNNPIESSNIELLKKVRDTSECRVPETHINTLKQSLLKVVGGYAVAMNCPYVSRDEGLIMLKYVENQHYEVHADFGSSNQRVMSGIFYLNDNYEGGELYFPFFDLTIKPEAGMLILFPSNYAYSHKANAVTSGTKYAVVTWFK